MQTNCATDDKPMAAPGLISYRCALPYGRWIMIGARDDADALNEAKRSWDGATADRLQVWSGEKYVPVTQPKRQQKRDILLCTESHRVTDAVREWLAKNGWEPFDTSDKYNLHRFIRRGVPLDQYEAWTEAPPFFGSMAAFTRQQITKRKMTKSLKTRRFDAGRFTSTGFVQY